MEENSSLYFEIAVKSIWYEKKGKGCKEWG